MRYRLRIDDETADVEASIEAEKGDALFTSGPEENHVSFKALAANCYFLTLNGKSTRVFVARGGRGKHVFIKGHSFLVQEDDDLGPRRERRGGADHTPDKVSPPMPSVVVRVLVKEGDMVKRGQGLVVVTAMKMETTLVAPWNGRIEKINTFQGAKVAPGDILVEIEKEVVQDEF